MENAPFKVGDKVTTDYMGDAENVVRTVISVEYDKNYGSHWKVIADGGEPCACCNRPFAFPLVGHHGDGIDSGWFKKVEK